MSLWYDWENHSLEEVSSAITNNIRTYLDGMNSLLQEAVDVLDFVVEGDGNETDKESCRYVLQLLRSIVEGKGGVVIPGYKMRSDVSSNMDYKKKGDDSHGNHE